MCVSEMETECDNAANYEWCKLLHVEIWISKTAYKSLLLTLFPFFKQKQDCNMENKIELQVSLNMSILREIIHSIVVESDAK